MTFSSVLRRWAGTAEDDENELLAAAAGDGAEGDGGRLRVTLATDRCCHEKDTDGAAAGGDCCFSSSI